MSHRRGDAVCRHSGAASARSFARLVTVFLVLALGALNSPAGAQWRMLGTDITLETGGGVLRPPAIHADAGTTTKVLELAEQFAGESDGIAVTGFAADRLSGNHVFFALARAADNARDGDVIRCAIDDSTCTLAFIAETAGVPDGVGVSAIGVEVSGGTQNLLLSFDTSFEAAGQVYRPADVLRFDGVEFSMALSHAETGAEPYWNLTGVAQRPDGTWHLAFDIGGEIGATRFFSSDVLNASGDGTISGHFARLRDEDVDWQRAGVAAWDRLTAGRARFATLASAINHGQTEVTLVVDRAGGSEGRIEVDYTTLDGSATAGTDYEAASGTLVWQHGESGTRDITLTILNTDGSENDLDFELRLSASSTWALTGNPDSLALTIPNDDVLFSDGYEG
ncbi:MAG: Calx-beta domain-containing protein [Wenzhouxiangellaceae bacterium]